MTEKSFAGTPEAAYVTSLRWTWDGVSFTLPKTPDAMRNKLRDIFNLWGIGFHGDTRDCKSGQVNIIVNDRQFKRVGIILPRPNEEEICNKE